MRILKYSGWVFLSLSAVSGLAQSSQNGSFKGRTFTDTYFQVAFDLPTILQPRPNTAVKLHATENRNEFMMAAAQQNNDPFGIVLIAERIHTDSGKIQTPEQFLHAVILSRSPSDILGKQGHVVSSSGLVFDWLDWKVPHTEFDSAVLTRRGDYFIVARCNAKTESDLQAMKAALMAMRITSK